MKELHEINWKIFFDVLLPDYSERIGYGFDSNQLTLIVDSEIADEVKSQLEKILRSRASLYGSLPYSVAGVPLDEDNTKIPLPPSTREECIELFESLIGEDAVADCELDTAFPKRGSEFVNGMLFSREFKKQVEGIQLPKLKHILAYFSHATQENIRKAWLDANFHLPAPENYDEVVSHLQEVSPAVNSVNGQGDLQSCFCSLQEGDNDKHFKLCIDVLKLFNLVFPPVLSSQKSQDGSKVLLQFDLNHLYQHIKALLIDDVLLRVTVGDQQEVQAQPVFFVDAVNNMQKVNKHVLIIDISSSMQKDFDELRNRIKEYLKRLTQIDPSATVRLVFFNEGATFHEVQGVASSLDLLETQLNQVRPNGGTRLFDTVAYELVNIKKQLAQYSNVMITLFTDGQNNEGSKTDAKIKKVTSELIKEEKQQLLIYTFGYGENHDNALLNELATSMCGEYTELNYVDDFQLMVADLSQRQVGRRLMDFIRELQDGTVEKFRVPVPTDDQPHAIHVRFALSPEQPVLIKFDGKEMKISVPVLAAVPQKNITDQLSDVIAEATELTSRVKEMGYGVVLERLQELASKVEKIKQVNELPINRHYAESITKTLEDATKLINKARQNQGFSNSIQAALQNNFRSFSLAPPPQANPVSVLPSVAQQGAPSSFRPYL